VETYGGGRARRPGPAADPRAGSNHYLPVNGRAAGPGRVRLAGAKSVPLAAHLMMRDFENSWAWDRQVSESVTSCQVKPFKFAADAFDSEDLGAFTLSPVLLVRSLSPVLLAYCLRYY
jgi:hypothetical protein